VSICVVSCGVFRTADRHVPVGVNLRGELRPVGHNAGLHPPQHRGDLA
jgi:hypothetical protein